MSEWNESHHPLIHGEQPTLIDAVGERVHDAMHVAGRAVTFLTGATVEMVRSGTHMLRH